METNHLHLKTFVIGIDFCVSAHAPAVASEGQSEDNLWVPFLSHVSLGTELRLLGLVAHTEAFAAEPVHWPCPYFLFFN